MSELKLLRINWEGPLSLEEVLGKKDEDKDYGLYQIYAHHMVFGLGALVYIGKAQEQTFAVRFTQHGNWLEEENEVSIRLGRLDARDYRSDTEWSQLIADAEKLTIFWHSPPFNSCHIQEYTGQALRIQNWRNHGSLLPEYSSDIKPTMRRPDDSDQE